MVTNPIDDAICDYLPSRVYALFSGGNDSLASTHYSMNHGADTVVHIDTGIGVDEHGGLSVIRFVKDTCKKYHWPLRIMRPPMMSYEEMVLKFGFPGPGAHRYPYSWLKERCIRQLVRESKRNRNDTVALCTGVRRSESARRMGYVKPIYKVGGQVWVAPFFDQDKIYTLEYIRDHQLEVSPVVRLIGMSGECFCGAFAKPKEFAITIQPNFPKLARKIARLERKAQQCGVRNSIWGVRPRKNPKNLDLPFMPMCVNCHGSRT
jgi:3'-phosphoadenosine 5'-phosphosulfate sulfotransferase (PAPS reductase)/FAD synthetase